MSDGDSLLSNATITLKGTNINTTSNQDGVFSLSATGTKNVLVVSFVGY